MTLIPRIGGIMTRSTIGAVGASKIPRQLRTIISFALPLLARLNKAVCLDIIDKALPDQATVIDLDSNTIVLSFGASIYGGEKVESMLDYVDKNVTVYITWLKIQKEVTEIETTPTNRLKRFFAITFQSLNPLFLGQQNIESIRAFVIAPRPEFKLGRLYRVSSRME